MWSDTDAKYAGTRIIFLDTEPSNWTWDPVAGAYYWHRFFSHQPDLNFANPHVRKAVFRNMRFWLDMGVDGLRLDAVPYLCEREGTNNENLPETHAVLKEIRQQLDQHYNARMLLAEANQWPDDVRPYFGDGDECHMAFHFPLMPRIFMALRQEDRHPITEILRRMPEIPPTCQWALFLRNHDELTLEMVTDAQYVLNHERFLLERLQALRQVEAGITQIRCHGDYHLGQVLWVENNFVILDFEGEPARSLAERRRKFSPLKDVADMLRSLSYAAYAALFAFLENRPADFPQLEPWAQFWQQWTSVSFMQGYLATVAGATFLPQESQHLATLLEGFLLDKVLYELDDELNHRPDWLRIPLQGIMQLLLPADLWPLDNPAY